MAHLIAWFAACAVLAWVLRNRLHCLLALVVGLWIAVPSVAGHHLTGQSSGALALHPATWLVGVVFAVQLVTHPQQLVGAIARHVYLAWIMAVFVLGAFVTSQLTGSGGTTLLVDQIVGPGLVFWLVLALVGEPRRVLFVRNAFLVVMILECALSLTQLALGRVLLYADDYATLYWFVPERFDRWMGTLDSPLDMSLCLAVAAGLSIGVKNWVLRSTLLILYLVGDLLTQSRTGAAVLCLIILVAIVRGRMAAWARALASLALVVAGYFILTSTIVTGLTQRFVNDTGSTHARIAAVEFVARSWQDYLFVGDGLTSSYTIGRTHGLNTSLESSLLMYSLDVGFVLAVVYFGAQFVLLVRYGRQRLLPGATLAALLACVTQHSFSGIASSNATGTIIWLSLGLMVAGHEIDSGSLSSRPSDIPMPQPRGDLRIVAMSDAV